MGITINDLKRAILNGGDCNTFTGFWQKALGKVPVPVLASLQELAPIPEPAALLRQIKPELVPLLDSWSKREDHKKLPKSEATIKFITLPSHGKHVSAFLERVIEERYMRMHFWNCRIVLNLWGCAILIRKS